MTQTKPEEQSGAPGRYQRSVSGLVAALAVLVLVVGAFVLFRGSVRDNPDATPIRPVDYGAVTRVASEQTGWPVVAPADLPKGWVATSVTWTSEPGASWHLGMITKAEEYVAIEEAEQPLQGEGGLLSEHVDADVERRGDVVLPTSGAAGTSWAQWAGADGDLAISTEVDGHPLLLVTSGTLADLRAVTATLTLR